MKFNSQPKIVIFAFIIFFISNLSFAQFKVKEYTILKHGTLILTFHDSWKELQVFESPDTPPKIKFFTKEGEINISYHWNLTQISNSNVSQIALARLKKAGESLLDRSIEKSLKIKFLSTKKDKVFSFHLTDKRDLQKGFKCLTHGSTTKGNLILLVTIFSNSTKVSVIQQALKMIGEADFVYNRSKK